MTRDLVDVPTSVCVLIAMTIVHLTDPTSYTIGDTGSNDTIAYVKRGYPIGNISINMPYGLEYSEYRRWQEDVEKMRQRFLSAPDSQLGNITDESNLLLDTFFESGGIVESIEIYW